MNPKVVATGAVATVAILGAAYFVTKDDAPSAGESTLSMVEDLGWAENVSIEIADDKKTFNFKSDGVPNHEIDEQILVPFDPVNIGPEAATVSPNLTAPQNYDFTIPLEPEWSEDTVKTSFGPIGVMISGAALHNPFEGNGEFSADVNFEVDGVSYIDGCNGHPQGEGAYHYHGVPTCITENLDEEGKHSKMIGVAFDGYAIFGPKGDAGKAPEDLDECNGHTGSTPEDSNEFYHYHLTETESYSLTCFHGKPAEVAPTTPAGLTPTDPGETTPTDPAQGP